MSADLRKRLERGAYLLLVLSAACYVFAASLRYGLLPRVESIREYHSDVRRYRRLMEQQSGKDAIKKQVQEKHTALEEKQSSLTAGMGDSQDLSGLLQVLFDKAQQAGVRIDKAQPREESRGEDFTRYPIVLEMSAKYHSLGRFVAALERIPHVMRIERLAVTARKNGGLHAMVLVTCFLNDRN